MTPIPDILDELRGGRMVVLADDARRENEGDLVIAAQFAAPEHVNFMLREARGMMCVALAGAICDRLDLEPQARHSTALRSTAYTVSVDAAPRFGVTTGVSAADRATTIRLLADEATRPGDLARPGHTQPLRARDGGTLVRAGQTEGSVDLCRLAGLTPAAVIIEVMNDDGTMARDADLRKLCARHNLKMCSVADVIHHRLQREKLVERIAEAPFENDIGQFTLIAYRSQVDPFPHVALVCGEVGRREIAEPVLVRMHRQNLLGDVLGDATQPTHDTLRRAMRKIHDAGRGAVVYLRHDRGGEGLLAQLHTAHTTDADAGEVTRHMDAYGIGCQILRDLGLSRLRLLTDHPFTPTALSGFDLCIESFEPVQAQECS